MAITQVISTLPDAPDPATDTRDQFSTKAAASVLAQKAMVPELNAWAEQVNAISATSVGDVATAIGAASADTLVDADKFGWRKTADGLLKSITFANLKTTLASTFASLAGSSSQEFSCSTLSVSSAALNLNGSVGRIYATTATGYAQFNNDTGSASFTAYGSNHATKAGLVEILGNTTAIGTISATTTIKAGGYIVSTLPAGVTGDECYVTDAAAPAWNTALTGGGAVVVGARKNATVWVAF